jgi:hypothetical protein
MECTRCQITRTLASDHKDFGFNLCVAPSRIALSSILEVRSISPEVKGVEGRVVCPTFKWTRSSKELRKDVGDRNNT